MGSWFCLKILEFEFCLYYLYTKWETVMFRTNTFAFWESVGTFLNHTQESKGNCSGLTKRIAGIGKGGAYPGNCERDLYRVLDLPLEPYLKNQQYPKNQ